MGLSIKNCTALTGGASRALDSYAVATLIANGGRAIVLDASNNLMFFEFQSAATDAENTATHPYRVRPDDYSSAGVWYEQLTIDRPLNRARCIWKDADEIYLNAAAYMHRGTKDQVVYWDSQLTFQFGSEGSNAGSDDLANNDWFYVYLDDSAIVTAGSPVITAVQLVGSITEPTWSDSKHGWYNGSDRCIFAVKTKAAAAEILEFFHDGDFVRWADYITDASAVSPDTWTDQTLTMPKFSNQCLSTVQAIYDDVNSGAYYRTNGQTGGTGIFIGNATPTETQSWLNVIFITDSSQRVELSWEGVTANTIYVYNIGWYLPIGM